MAQRLFIDSAGLSWNVWEVFPQFAERRLKKGRPPTSASERRHQAAYRVPIDTNWVNGWLVFESAHEKRRIAPIPREWTELSDEELEKLLEGATVRIGRQTRRLIE